MTKCFFYTDPLAAAWMAKHHTMRFTYLGVISARAYEAGLSAIESHISLGHLQLLDGRFYVHPASLPLLEPCGGDIVIGEVPEQGYNEVVFYQQPQTAQIKIGRVIQILQRNGIAYMWPESEDA